MLLIVGGSGAAVLLRPPPRSGDLVVWVFAMSHAESLRGDGSPNQPPTLIEQYQQRTGQRVEVKLINNNALNLRLMSIFDRLDRDEVSGETPDLATIEIGSVGRYFRPPVQDVGFLPLNEYLKRSGYMDRIVPPRLATWSKRGVIFGVPHDVHPVTITYRKDLFDEADINLASAQTWPEFQDLCLAFQAYWHERGHPHRYAIELPFAASDYLVCMLLQRHINLIDDEDRIYMAEPIVAETLAYYVRLVSGRRRIGATPTPGTNMWMRDLDRGDICAFITADWRATYLKNLPNLAGKLAMMPLPRFEPTDAPTATWGGTMIGIPRTARDPDEAWRLIEFFYFSPEGLAARQRVTKILPPVRDFWNDPLYNEPDPFYGGQRVGQLFVELGDQIPTRYVTPYTTMAIAQLSQVLTAAVEYHRARGDSGLEEHCQQLLNDAAQDLQRRIDFGRIDE
jgi:arabinosaccharide transport system substrate-binding protein